MTRSFTRFQIMYFNAIDNRPEHGSFIGSLTPDSIVVFLPTGQLRIVLIQNKFVEAFQQQTPLKVLHFE